MENFVECPKCGFAQPDGDECISCGIIYAKYWAMQEQLAPPAAAVPPEPAQAVQPQAVQPQVVQPQAVQPQAVQPQAVQPQAVQPQAVQPQAVQPQVVQPQAVQPQAVQPQAVQPQAVQPQAVQPQAVQPEAVQPQAVQPQAVQPQAVQPQAVQPQAVQPQAVQPQAVQPQAVQPQVEQPQPAQTPSYEELLAQAEAAQRASQPVDANPFAGLDTPTSAQPVPAQPAQPVAGQPAQPTGAPAAPAQSASAQRPSSGAPHRVFRADSGTSVPIGKSTMVIRTLAGIACLGIAVLMFANGKGLLSAWPYVIMVFYAGAALWGVSSFRQQISIQQFAVEMAILVAVTLGLRIAAPEMFTVESSTKGVPKVVQPHLPPTPLGGFTKRVLAYVEAGHGMMLSHDLVPKAQWDGWTRDTAFDAVKGKYTVLSTDERARVWDIWKRVEEVGPMLTDMLGRYTQESPDGVRFTAPETERLTIKRELGVALQKAGELRARLLVYPEFEDDF